MTSKQIQEIEKEIKYYEKLVENDILTGNSFIVLSNQHNYWNLKGLNEFLARLDQQKKAEDNFKEMIMKHQNCKTMHDVEGKDCSFTCLDMVLSELEGGK